MHEEIMSRLNFGNACYYSVPNLLFSSLLSKNLKIKMYETIILPVILCGCETCFLTLREEDRLCVFDNRMLRRIPGPKREEVVRGWIRLHNEELHNFYASPYIIRLIKSRMRWAGHAACMGEMRNTYKILVRTPKVQRPTGRPRHRGEDNIRMDLRKIGWEDVDWIHLAQDRECLQAW
jgi:hypothetical protein